MKGEASVTTTIPRAYVVNSGYMPHGTIAAVKSALGFAFALWPLTGTMLAIGGILLSL